MITRMTAPPPPPGLDEMAAMGMGGMASAGAGGASAPPPPPMDAASGSGGGGGSSSGGGGFDGGASSGEQVRVPAWRGMWQQRDVRVRMPRCGVRLTVFDSMFSFVRARRAVAAAGLVACGAAAAVARRRSRAAAVPPRQMCRTLAPAPAAATARSNEAPRAHAQTAKRQPCVLPPQLPPRCNGVAAASPRARRCRRARAPAVRVCAATRTVALLRVLCVVFCKWAKRAHANK